jgi:hypothetical protein
MAAEVFAAITSLRSALEVTKAMIGLRDAEAFRAKSIELQGLILESLDKAIEAREAYAAQLDEVRALKAEVADLKQWGAEKENYELRPNWTGSVAYMLKPEARGSEPAHWLCPNCYSQGKKSFLLPLSSTNPTKGMYKCATCRTETLMSGKPKWDDAAQISAG